MRSNKGFTLVELVLYLGLMSILVVLTTDFFVSSGVAVLESSASTSLERDYSFIIQRLKYDIDRARSVSTPATLGQSSSSLVLVINNASYTYSISNNKLRLNESGTVSDLNSSETTAPNFTFQRLGNSGGKPVIKIVGTLTSVTLVNQEPRSKNISLEYGLN